MPTFVRRLIFDSIVGAAVAVATLNIALPRDVQEAQAAGFVVLSAVATAAFKAAGRAFPAFTIWLALKLNVDPNE